MQKVFKVNNFDLIRIFAAVQVLILHTVYHLKMEDSVLYHAWAYFPGVPIFYALSGYLISASYERASSLKQYFQNRALRIFPGLWACLFVTIIVTSFLGYSYFNKSAPLWLLSQMAGLIYTPDFLRTFGFGTYNGSLWTIAVELQFYFALPLVYFLMGKEKKNSVLLLVFFLFVVIAFVSKVFLPGIGTENELSYEKLFRYTFIPHFYLFLAGVVMQRFQFYKSDWIHGKGLHWFVLYVAVETILLKLNMPVLSVISLLLLTVCAISVAYTGGGIAHKILKGNDISYGVYIYHGLVLSLLVHFKMWTNPLYLAVVLGGAGVLGYLSWIFVERPFLLRKKRTINSNLAETAPQSVQKVTQGA
jgi:peptidoglycan/LPS O-acetylase OafA/YrhL